MKNLKLVLCLFLFFLSTVHLQAGSEKSHKKQKLSCFCESDCQLPCLKNEDCTLIFGVSASVATGDLPLPLIGNFVFSIFAPNGEKVASTTIDASKLTPTESLFFLNVKPPICAGVYTVSITNQSVTFSDGSPINFEPFLDLFVTNNCNQNCIIKVFPFAESTEFSIEIDFPVGCSIQQLVEIDPPFVNFEKCKTHCKCEKSE